MVFGCGEDSDDVDGCFEECEGVHEAEDGHSAAFVVDHFAHFVRGFDGDSAGVEGDGFSDDEQGLAEVFGGGGFVFEGDEAGGCGAAGADAEDSAHAEFFHLFFVEGGELQAGFGCEVFGDGGEGEGVDVVAGAGGDGAGEVGGEGGDAGVVQALGGGGGGWWGGEEVDSGGAFFGEVFGFAGAGKKGEVEGGEEGSLGEGGGNVGGGMGGEGGEQKGGVGCFGGGGGLGGGVGFAGGAEEGGGGAAEGLGVELWEWADADGADAVGGFAEGDIGGEELAGLAGVVGGEQEFEGGLDFGGE